MSATDDNGHVFFASTATVSNDMKYPDTLNTVEISEDQLFKLITIIRRSQQLGTPATAHLISPDLIMKYLEFALVVIRFWKSYAKDRPKWYEFAKLFKIVKELWRIGRGVFEIK